MQNRLIRSWLLVAALLAFNVTVAAEALQDGPYVTDGASGGWMARWVEGETGAPQVREQPVAVGSKVTVPAIGSLPAFEVELRGIEKTAPDEIRANARVPIFVMADTHGEFEIAVELLQRNGIVDSALHWSFGKGRLAILGDVFDRGARQTELLWLFYQLEAEAARAGGAVHLALGNHEVMVLSGDERYLNPKYRSVAAALGARRYAQLWSEQTLLGRWLRSKAAVFRLGDNLCLHGGISREVIDRGLMIADINRAVRASLSSAAVLSEVEREQVAFVTGKAGPLWYRGYFPDAARDGGFIPAGPADVDIVRDTYKVSRILVGHTIVPSITSLYEGRVIAVQVYPHRDEKTAAPVMEGLLIRGGKLFRARIDGTQEPLLR